MGFFSKLFTRDDEGEASVDGEQSAAQDTAHDVAHAERSDSAPRVAPGDVHLAGDPASAGEPVEIVLTSDEEAEPTARLGDAAAPPVEAAPASAAVRPRTPRGERLTPPIELPASVGTARSTARVGKSLGARPRSVPPPLPPRPEQTPTRVSQRSTASDLPGAGAPRQPRLTPKARDSGAGAGRFPPDTQAALDAPGAPPPAPADVDAALDRLLETVRAPEASSPERGAGRADRRAVAETFRALATEHAQHIRELMFQLGLGCTPRRWAAACRPIVAPLLDAATQIELVELKEALDAFDAALGRAAAGPTSFVDADTAAQLHTLYRRLSAEMPDAFEPLDPSEGRRRIVLESLLLQVRGMHRRTLEKLYAAGLGSLEQLQRAAPEELAAVAGIESELARAVSERLERFERERKAGDGAEPRERALPRLRSSLSELAQSQQRFERAEQREAIADKRQARREREAAALELNLLLAEIGELAVVEELKRVPVRAKIDRVERYLQSARLG